MNENNIEEQKIVTENKETEKEYSNINTKTYFEEPIKKGNVAKTIVLIIVCLLVGLISGAYLLKILNTNVKNDSFMYDILKGSGLLTNNVTYATPSNMATPADYEEDGEDNGMTFIKSKNGINYYYQKTDEGDYLYYYSYSGSSKILYYYASDANANLMNTTYMDAKDPEKYEIINYVGKKYKEMEEDIDFENTIVMFVKNDAYEAGTIYYQDIKPGKYNATYDPKTDTYNYLNITLIVNASSQEEIDNAE